MSLDFGGVWSSGFGEKTSGNYVSTYVRSTKNMPHSKNKQTFVVRIKKQRMMIWIFLTVGTGSVEKELDGCTCSEFHVDLSILIPS